MTDANALAQACSEAMHANDDASKMLGMEILKGTPGGDRSGIYDVEVSNQNGDVIALFRGKSYQIKGQFIPDNGGLT